MAYRRLYDGVLAGVADNWELDARDLALLDLAAACADTAAELEKVIRTGGMTCVGSTGQPVLNAAVSELRLQRQAIAGFLAKVEISPPAVRTGHMNRRQRNQLADARAVRWAKDG